MAISRYTSAPILSFGFQQGTTRSISAIRYAVNNGQLITDIVVMKGFARLDSLAFDYYGDGRYWWVLAAASNIGWGLQVPAGTEIKIPRLQDVLNYVITGA
jgi:hypothetical protein